MGTRHLIGVIDKEGTVKVAQYGQFDGYPAGQGEALLSRMLEYPGFISKLEDAITICRFLDSEGKDKNFVEEYNSHCPNFVSNNDNRTDYEKRIYDKFWDRELSSVVLLNIIDEKEKGKKEVILQNQFSFLKDSLFCEWAYIINFQTRMFECYCGFVNKPHETNKYFDGKIIDDGYYPVKMLKEYPLSELPDIVPFISDLISAYEDERKSEE